MVRSNEYGGIGFLGRPEDGPRRLNVAITRAKQFCGIIGDWRTLTAEREDKCSGLYQDLYSYLVDTGRMQDVDAKLLDMQADDITG
jgi:superfamily I DNA and/or RNA helicase